MGEHKIREQKIAKERQEMVDKLNATAKSNLPNTIRTCNGCNALKVKGCDPFNGTIEWYCEVWNESPRIISFGDNIDVPIPKYFDNYGSCDK